MEFSPTEIHFSKPLAAVHAHPPNSLKKRDRPILFGLVRRLPLPSTSGEQLSHKEATMGSNQVNVSRVQSTPSLSQADQDAIMQAIETIRQKLSPFSTDLTRAERKRLAKLGDKTHAFVKKAV